MADSTRVLALVHFYARSNYPQHLQTVCKEVVKRSPGDHVSRFWLIYGKILEGSYSEALQELQRLPPLPDTSPAATAAMILAHQSAKVVDHEAIASLTSQVEMLEKTCSEQATILLSQFYWHSGSVERARMLIERVLRMSGHDSMAQVLLGWMIISQQNDDFGLDMEDEIEEALGHFDAVLLLEPHIEGMMGKAKALEMKKDYRGALTVLQEAMARHPWFFPAASEVARLLLALNRWDEAMESVAGMLASDPRYIDGLLIKAMHSIVCEGNTKTSASIVRDLKSAIQIMESKNGELCYQMARLFCRLAGGDSHILEESLALAERAVQLVPENPAYVFEVGYQRMLMGDLDEALRKFQFASSLNEFNMDVMYGTVECQIRRGMLEDAELQLEMLSDASMAGGNSAYIAYLKAFLAVQKGIGAEEGSVLVERAFLQHQKEVDNLVPGKDLFLKLNISRILDIVSKVINGMGSDPKGDTEAPSPYLPKITRILRGLSRYAPGHLQCHILLAQAHFLDGNMEAAMRMASELQRLNPGESRAHLLVCRIYLHQGKLSSARLALDEAVGASFAVRQLPSYHIVNAEVLMAEESLDEAKMALETAMGLPGVKFPLKQTQLAEMQKKNAAPTLHERVSIFLLLAKLHMKIKKDSPEATKIINDAMREFENTSEHVRVTIADCQLSIGRGDIQSAVRKLKNITSESPHFQKARIALANIHLRQRNDKAAYVKCYLDLSERCPGFDTNLMLGEALMHIQEPEKAILAFESALELNPKDSDLACKIGQALVTTHEYQRAVDFYNKAIRNNPMHLRFQHDLAMLLLRLKRHDQAVQVLNKALGLAKQITRPVEQQTLIVDTLVLLAKVFRSAGNIDDFIGKQQEAFDLNLEVVAKMRGEHPDLINDRKKKLSSIGLALGEHHMEGRQYAKAEEILKSALEHCEGSVPVREALARICLAQGNIEESNYHCTVLLKSDPENENVGTMVAEIMFYKDMSDSAALHFQNIIEKQPCNFRALASLLRILRLSGKIQDMDGYINAAIGSQPPSEKSAGLEYCQGLHCRFLNKPNEAITHFSAARKESEWAAEALFQMVEVALNPDNNFLWMEQDGEEKESLSMLALSLLDEVPANAKHSTRYNVLHAYATMYTRNLEDVQKALADLLTIASKDQTNVPVLLAMASGFMILGQKPKARNQLKRVQKLKYRMDEAEDFERSWLLLADIHIQGGKFDLAQDLCKKCLKYNKSCAKAWEYMGQIMEREQAYQDAANHYQSAWKFENEASAQVGYKLAFNYLKAERFAEAIDVCNKVLKENPEYPQLKTDIMNKAVAGLRP
ncbi:hypothetical protein BSKO_02171 [Bryopsis sp. KO-2023]|nr:hypothetical protein BSKO_02171 [Bryopsis sp. KO-2023]